MANNGLDQFRQPNMVNETPNLEDLERYFIPQYAAKWKTIAQLLDVPSGQITLSEGADNTTSCKYILDHWVGRHNLNPSWGKLFAVIDSPPVSVATNRVNVRPLQMDLQDGSTTHEEVDTTPLLGDLKQYMTSKYAAKWKEIGRKLNLPIETIETEGSIYDAVSCCNKMWEYWLQGNNASWERLFTVIESDEVSGNDRTGVDTTPLLRDLQQCITPYFAAQWKKIGKKLRLPFVRLKVIEVGNPTNDVKWCCEEMWQKWLQNDPEASWRKVFEVVAQLSTG